MTHSQTSLERIVPEALVDDEATGAETLALHLERYRFAAGQLAGGRVLDLACGVGYGSRLLAQTAGVRFVVAADLSADALHHARLSYGDGKVALVRGNGADCLRSDAFDAVVSLETVEHVEQPRAFVAELARVLVPGGLLVASVPTTPSVDANPHHRTDFTERSFLAIGRDLGLTVVATLRQVQPFAPIAVVTRQETRAKGLRPNLPAYYAHHPMALVRRLAATVRFGFTNRYLTVVWRRPIRAGG